MRRMTIVALALFSLGCDPTGNLGPALDAAQFRFANFVSDANGLTVARSGTVLASGVTFGDLSGFVGVTTGQAFMEVRRASDGFVLALDTVNLVKDRRYTYYALGKPADLRPVLALQDTTPATAGQYKVRFAHSVGSEDVFTLDFYADTASSLASATPTYPGLSFGSAGVYVSVDTGVRRFRWTRNGSTTPIFDTTFASALPSGAVVTFVLTNAPGSASTYRVAPVDDTAP